MRGLLLDPKKDTSVTLAQLERMPDPEPLGRWHRPYRYDEIFTELMTGAERSGYEVVRSEMALSRGEKMLLGILQLQKDADRFVAGMRTDIALGFRASTHSLSALKCVAGEHVWLCSNLRMSGEMFIVSRKFTSGLNLRGAIDEGFITFGIQHETMSTKLQLMACTNIDDSYAKVKIFDAITKDKLPMGIARDVAKLYFGGEEYGGETDEQGPQLTEDCAPRTELGLYNAFTRSLREYPAQPRFEHTQTVGKVFGL